MISVLNFQPLRGLFLFPIGTKKGVICSAGGIKILPDDENIHPTDDNYIVKSRVGLCQREKLGSETLDFQREQVRGFTR